MTGRRFVSAAFGGTVVPGFGRSLIAACGICAGSLGGGYGKVAADDAFGVDDFIGAYCIECHDTDRREGDREFETFTLPLENEGHWIAADEIIDQLTLNLMPPAEADQPPVEERLAVLEALRVGVREGRDLVRSTGGRTVLRRLSRREYEQTLATLFDRRVDTLGLTADFPRETTDGHLDTIGDALVTSGFLLDQYFQAADRLVESRLNKPATEPQWWHFKDNFKQYEELSNSHRSAFKYRYLCLYEQPNTDTRQGGYGHIEDFLQGVPVAGLYDVQVLVRAMHRDTHYDPGIFGIDFAEPFRLGVVPGDVTLGHIHYPQAVEPLLAEAVVPDDAFEWVTFRVWLEAGQTPRFIFPNGPYESRASIIKLNKRYQDEFKKPTIGVSRTSLLRQGKLPHIRIDEVKIHGPLPEPGGSREELAVFGPDGFQPDSAVQQLYDFAIGAFRRPLGDEDRDRIAKMFARRIGEDASPRQAALDTVKLILCSPSFLYLREITPDAGTDEHRDDVTSRLGPYDLASRLSYALWSAPPDDALFALAESGAITDPEVLASEVDRMLDDSRSDRFIAAFLDGWLNLRDLGNLPPPRQAAPEYYAEALPASMKQETRLFFRHLIDNNASLLDWIDADYTFVDAALAKLYELPAQDRPKQADGFVRADVSAVSERGGMLGMAGVLTVSANGVETSPVTRGVWVLENVLGVRPSPPPDEVPSIDADTRGAKTIREKLTRHSRDEACYVCHRNMDPLGYALEKFDPIGRVRSRYPKSGGGKKAAAIDTSGKLPSGEAFDDFSEFKTVLRRTRHDAFTRHVVTTLLSFATGRRMEAADKTEIRDITQRVRGDNYGARTMITQVLTSDIFRSR